MNFERPHHQAIALVLSALDGRLLREHNCFFGGGTAIALRHGEYRESIDIDFLVSDLACYRNLRQLLAGNQGMQAIARHEPPLPFTQAKDIRIDQYGIRTQLAVASRLVKFEIVLEGRIQLSTPNPNDLICGVATLTPLDMVTSKLLANSDRWADKGVFSRDLIDLAMMEPPAALLAQAVANAQMAYGQAVISDLSAAIEAARTRRDWLERCMQAMGMTLPKALLWKRIRALRKVLPEK